MPCSKNDALRLLRKLVIAKVLTEETYRQDNQYGGVLSYLAVNESAARALTQGTLTIKMPFAVGSNSCVSMIRVDGLCVSVTHRDVFWRFPNRAVCVVSCDELHELHNGSVVLRASNPQSTPSLHWHIQTRLCEAMFGRLCDV